MLALTLKSLMKRPAPRLPLSGFEVLVGKAHPDGFEVSADGGLLCPGCGKPMRVSAPHAGMDALVACNPCELIAVADRNVARLTSSALALASRPRR